MFELTERPIQDFDIWPRERGRLVCKAAALQSERALMAAPVLAPLGLQGPNGLVPSQRPALW
eukprot:5910189-Pyramimonas_sp.AAC.1